MGIQLELADIQGNILTAYGRLGFPKGRVLLLHVAKPAAGRAVVEHLRRHVTTALRWPSKRKPFPPGTIYQKRPQVAVNLGFTFYGLHALGVPVRTLRGMPDEFIDGMAARADILGDSGPRPISQAWDEVWFGSGETTVHIMVTLNAQMQADGTPVPALAEMTDYVAGLCDATEGGVRLLPGHRGEDARWQEMSALLEPGADGAPEPTPFEHFGFLDAIGDPVFDGQYPPEMAAGAAVGQGKLLPDQSWAPLATGEFLLGHADESQEIPGAAMPLDFSRNGTFFAYRKLHQNVHAFRDWVRRMAGEYAAVANMPEHEAEATLKAKIAGRWTDGVPLMAAPDYAAWQAFRERRQRATGAERDALDRAMVDFTFRDDPLGVKCPLGSHLRRSNTRDMLDPLLNAPPDKRGGSVLNNRRRILRRGLPYGTAREGGTDADEHGIIMLAACANLFRQFEFVQQQWMQYGLDFNLASEGCPIIGNHGPDAKFVIAVEPGSGRQPFIAHGMPQFVEVRGGDYFFIPSMTALRMIAQGLVDPT